MRVPTPFIRSIVGCGTFLIPLWSIAATADESTRAGGSDRQILRRDDATGYEFWWYAPEPTGPTKNVSVDDDVEAAGSADEPSRIPLILFLHGGGESGGDPRRILGLGLPKLIEAGRNYPAFVASPHNPGETKFWDDVRLVKLVDSLTRQHPIDHRRIYLTGLSRGGYGAWRAAIQNPNLFAAVVPIAGGGNPPYGFRLTSLPIWAFHGDADRDIPAEESQRMVDATNRAGGQAKLTLYPGVGHDSWSQTYERDDLWRWLFDQRRTDRDQAGKVIEP